MILIKFEQKNISGKIRRYSGGSGWIRTTEVTDNRFTDNYHKIFTTEYKPEIPCIYNSFFTFYSTNQSIPSYIDDSLTTKVQNFSLLLFPIFRQKEWGGRREPAAVSPHSFFLFPSRRVIAPSAPVRYLHGLLCSLCSLFSSAETTPRTQCANALARRGRDALAVRALAIEQLIFFLFSSLAF